MLYYNENLTGPHKAFDWAACGPRVGHSCLKAYTKPGDTFSISFMRKDNTDWYCKSKHAV